MYSFPGLNIAMLIGISGVVRIRSDILPVSSMIVVLIRFVFDNDKVVLLLLVLVLSLYCGVNNSESCDKRIAITLTRFRFNSWMLENISLSL
jgi:Ca2+/Na+ antiporter